MHSVESIINKRGVCFSRSVKCYTHTASIQYGVHDGVVRRRDVIVEYHLVVVVSIFFLFRGNKQDLTRYKTSSDTS